MYAGLGLTMAFVATCAHGQTSYPMLSRVHPVAIQRGQSAEIAIGGQGNFAGASAVLFEGKGLSADVVATDQPKTKSSSKKAKAANGVDSIRLRIRQLRMTPRWDLAKCAVITPRGASSVGQIVVVADPVVVEDDKNNDEPA